MLISYILASCLFINAESIMDGPEVGPILIPVLTYHRVLPKVASIYDYTPEQLEEHFHYFKDNGYTPITALEMVDQLSTPGRLPEKPVVLTFDDGHNSHYTRVFPLLKNMVIGLLFLYILM